MTSPSLDLQDVLGDAIVTQLASDAITATVTTNPTQGGDYPFVVIGEDTETSENLNRDKIRSSIVHNIFAHSDSMVEVKQVARSIIEAVGPNGAALNLGVSFEEISRQLEANDLIPERRPEGDLYHALIRVRFLISHTGV